MSVCPSSRKPEGNVDSAGLPDIGPATSASPGPPRHLAQIGGSHFPDSLDKKIIIGEFVPIFQWNPLRGHRLDGHIEVGVLFLETFEKGPHLGDNAVWRLPRQEAGGHPRPLPVRD